MINGFVIDILNENNTEVSVSLFKNDAMPKGVIIYDRHSHFDYASLFLMSINEGFKGSGISTEDERICQVNIYKDNVPTSYNFHKILANKEIIIDGFSNYISIIIPAYSKTIVQLLPVYE